MIKSILSKVTMPLYFIVSALILEAVTFNMLSFGAMPQHFFFNLSIILFLAFLVFIIPNYTAQYVIYTIILLVQVILIYVNYSLYTIYGDIFSMDMLRLVGEARAAISSSFIYLPVILQMVAVFLSIVITGGMLLQLCKKNKISLKEHFSIFNIIILIVLQCYSCGYYVNKRNEINHAITFDDVNYTSSDSFLMNTSFLKTSSYQKFGTYGYFSNLLLSSSDNLDEKLSKSTIEYFENGSIHTSHFEQTETKENVIVIMMESLEWICFGDGNYDPSLQNLSSEMTPNIYNLINADRSMISSNFFAKSKTNISEAYGVLGAYPVGSGMSDLAGESYNSNVNAFGYSMPNRLAREGYTTAYIHSNEISFYDRDKTHNNLGFETVVGKDSVVTKEGKVPLKDKEGNILYQGKDLEWDHWEAEGDFVRNTIDYIIPTNYQEKPFYSFYLSVSSHGAYEYNPTEVDCVRYKDYVMYGKDNCNWNTTTKVWEKKEDVAVNDYSTWYQNVIDNYQAKDSNLVKELLYYECGVIGLDEAVGVIVDKLKEYNIFDNTTLLLYSDHYSYYNSLSNRFKGLDTSDVSSAELNTIPMIISSSKLTSFMNQNYPSRTTNYLVNERFCSAYDVIPTLLDLLGVSYNTNLYAGQSLFSPADYIYEIDGETREMFVYYSNTGGLFSKDIYTYDMETFVTQNSKVDRQDIEIFKAQANILLKKINYINILNNHYLYNKLTKV